MSKIFDLNNYTDFESFENYKYIRAYHACKPICIDTYFKNGICSYTKEKAKEEIKSRLLVHKNVNIYNIDEIFEKEWEDDKQKSIWLNMNKRLLLEEAGHYLIYGSEFINSIACKIGRRDLLKNIGIPTIFICNVPIKDIDNYWVKGIENQIKRKNIEDLSIPLERLNPDNIVGVEHPNEIKDPYYYNTIYKYDVKNKD